MGNKSPLQRELPPKDSFFLLVIFIAWLLLIIMKYICLCVDKQFFATESNRRIEESRVLLRSYEFLSFCKQFSTILEPKCSLGAFNRPPLVSILSQKIQCYVHAPFDSFKINFNIIIASVPSSPRYTLPQFSLPKLCMHISSPRSINAVSLHAKIFSQQCS